MEARRRQGLPRPLASGLLRWALVLLPLRPLPVSGQGTRLKLHSIVNPPDINDLAADWFLAGTVMPSSKNLVLSPGVPGRFGALWSSSPLLTNDFEVSMTFTAKGPDKRTVQDEGFAFWYVYENGTDVHANITFEHAQNQEEMVANSWSQHFQAAGLDLLGYRSLYDGLGVFFLDDDQPSVSALTNNGKMPYKLRMGVPTAEALKFNFLDGQEVTLKIRVEPTKAKVEVVGRGTMEVQSEFRSGGYIGFSVLSGNRPGGYEAIERTSFVELKTLTVENYDKAAKGEEAHAPVSTYSPPKAEDRVDMLHDSSSFKDHRAESDAIKDLTNMVFKLVVETRPMRQQMTRAIESLGKRIGAMEKTFSELKVEIDKKTGHKLGQEFDAIKKELTSLSSVASRENQERHKRLESLHEDIADVHKSAHSPDNIDKHLDKLTKSNNKVLDQLTNEHQKMFGVSIAAIAFIIIAGLALYNKFRCWEKKHVL